jgi:Holliday junction resolvase RusA-like endonuclease
VRDALAEVGATFPLFDDGVKLKVTCTFHVFDTRKDIDNMVKFLLDCLQSVLFKNDDMIYFIVAKKIHTARRDLEFTKFEVENIVE